MAANSQNKGKIFLSTILLLLTVLVVGTVVLFVSQANDKSAFKAIPSIIKKDKPKKTEAPSANCPLDGLRTTPEAATRRPLAVMIENSPAARPQSALSKADLVMEALAEGGVTRFMAVYVHNAVEEVGPVRSARPYYLQVAQGFKALFAHVGGSKEAMNQIKKWGLADVDQFFNEKAYWRVKSRPSPHNMYTSTEKLREAARGRNYALEGEYQGFRHKSDVSLAERPQSQIISIDFSYPEYKVRYEYERVSNAYLRFVGAAPHQDKLTNDQLKPKNIAVIYVPTSNNKGGTLNIDIEGEGKALVFRDGVTASGTWEKPTLNSQILFFDASGQEITFNPGQIWLEVVRTSTSVTYQ